MVDAMVWIIRAGAPLEQARGLRRGLDELAKDADSIAYMVDATIVRVHPGRAGRAKGGARATGHSRWRTDYHDSRSG